MVVTKLSFAQRSHALLGMRPAFAGLASTEFCERFAVAGLKSLLTLVLVNHVLAAGESAVLGLAWVRSCLEAMFGPVSKVGLASQIYGLSNALLYLSVPLCGLLGDVVIGRRLAVQTGSVLMAGGLLMAASTWLALPGLFVFALGAGAVKGNLAAQVGELFADDQERRSAYALYLGFLNAGIVVGPLACGAASETLGWTFGLLAASTGAIVGLAIYSWISRSSNTGIAQRAQIRNALNSAEIRSNRAVPLLIVAIVAIFLCFAAYEQLSNLVLLWASRHVELSVAGRTIPAGWIVSLDGLLTILLIAATEWGFRAARHRYGWEMGEIARIVVGCGCCAMGYVVLAWAATTSNGGAVSFVWILAYVLLVDLAIVLVWPAGLSLISAHAPPTLIGVLIGVFYLHGFFANLWVGAAGAFYDRMELPLFWLMHAGIAASGCALLLLTGGTLSKFARSSHATTTSA